MLRRSASQRGLHDEHVGAADRLLVAAVRLAVRRTSSSFDLAELDAELLRRSRCASSGFERPANEHEALLRSERDGAPDLELRLRGHRPSSPGSVCSIVPLSTAPFLVDLLRPGDRQCARRTSSVITEPAAIHASSPIVDRGDERIVDPSPDVAPDRRSAPSTRVCAVVRRDRSRRAMFGVGTHVGVAEVREMRHLRSLADARVLDLDERARLRTGLEHRAGAKVTERARRVASSPIVDVDRRPRADRPPRPRRRAMRRG